MLVLTASCDIRGLGPSGLGIDLIFTDSIIMWRNGKVTYRMGQLVFMFGLPKFLLAPCSSSSESSLFTREYANL